VSPFVTAIKSVLLLAFAESISQHKWLYFRNDVSKPLIDVQTFDAAGRGHRGHYRCFSSLAGSYIERGSYLLARLGLGGCRLMEED
jgi:Protein of unknown function (DUF3176)